MAEIKLTATCKNLDGSVTSTETTMSDSNAVSFENSSIPAPGSGGISELILIDGENYVDYFEIDEQEQFFTIRIERGKKYIIDSNGVFSNSIPSGADVIIRTDDDGEFGYDLICSNEMTDRIIYANDQDVSGYCINSPGSYTYIEITAQALYNYLNGQSLVIYRDADGNLVLSAEAER